MSQPPPPNAPPPPSPRRGTPRRGATPRMENVRVTTPDLLRRNALEKTRARLLLTGGGFMLLFGAVVAKLATATIMFPMLPKPVAQMVHLSDSSLISQASATGLVQMIPSAHHPRADIIDRNGVTLAVSLRTAGLYANRGR